MGISLGDHAYATRDIGHLPLPNLSDICSNRDGVAFSDYSHPINRFIDKAICDDLLLSLRINHDN
jgi:hypothetical protein